MHIKSAEAVAGVNLAVLRLRNTYVNDVLAHTPLGWLHKQAFTLRKGLNKVWQYYTTETSYRDSFKLHGSSRIRYARHIHPGVQAYWMQGIYLYYVEQGLLTSIGTGLAP